MSLTQQLAQTRAAFLAQVADDIRQVMDQATAELAASGITETALNVGDRLPDATLSDHRDAPVNLYEQLSNGPLVVSFYRGGWCPYCNLELKALQAKLPQIRTLGANLIAITPELPDESLNTVEKNAIRFPVLTDVGSHYARECGLVFTLPESLRPVYDGFGIDVEKHNGAGQFDFPLAATYVVGRGGAIEHAFIDADYTKRLDPEQIMASLHALKAA